MLLLTKKQNEYFVTSIDITLNMHQEDITEKLIKVNNLIKDILMKQNQGIYETIINKNEFTFTSKYARMSSDFINLIKLTTLKKLKK